MASQLTNYKCLACTGPIFFNSQSGKLQCEYCGSAYTVEEMDAAYAEKQENATQAFEKEQQKKQDQLETAMANGGENWDTSALQDDWGEEGSKMVSYSCPSCSAEVICDETTAATSCLYCGNPTVVPGQFSGAFKPHYVIPFEIDKETAKQSLKKHYQGKFLLPKCFKDENHIEEIKGIYVPFWMFDGTAQGDISFSASSSSTHTSGDYRITTTKHYDVRREGTITFEKIPVDASSKMPDDYMESIEPFDYTDLKPFSTAYMPGYLADKYDVAVEQCAERANQRAEISAIESLQRTVTGYSSISIKSKHIILNRGQVKYVMAPVWLLNTRWKNKSYLFAVNGQTGKLVGDLPMSKGKYWATVLSIASAITIVGTLFGIL